MSHRAQHPIDRESRVVARIHEIDLRRLQFAEGIQDIDRGFLTGFAQTLARVIDFFGDIDGILQQFDPRFRGLEVSPGEAHLLGYPPAGVIEFAHALPVDRRSALNTGLRGKSGKELPGYPQDN